MVVEPPLPDVVVTVEPALPEVQVTASEVGLVGPPGSAADISEHINDPTPHAVYDDGPDLALLYENAKV